MNRSQNTPILSHARPAPVSFLSGTGRASFLDLLFVLALLLGAGCASISEPRSASFASVIIRGADAQQVRAATAQAFKAAEWHDFGSDSEGMVFEREASQFDHIAHGSNVSDVPVINRVRVQVVPLADGSLRLQCQAYVVRDRGNPGVSDEVRLKGLRAGPYQEMLDKIAASFDGTKK